MPAAPAAATPIVAVLALALTGTALAFWLFAWAQSHVPAEVAGAFVNLEPLVGAATGAIVFHDAVGTPQLLGGAAILLGIGLGALPRNRPAVAEAPARRPVVRERRSPHAAARPVAHRPSRGPPMSVAHPTRTHRARDRVRGERSYAGPPARHGLARRRIGCYEELTSDWAAEDSSRMTSACADAGALAGGERC